MWEKAKTIGNYLINEKGEVKNANTNKIIKPFIHKSGYKYVTCCDKGQQKNYRLHRLIAQSFIPNPNNYPVVNHKDLNKQNNSIDNLEWTTNKENNLHSLRLQGRRKTEKSIIASRKNVICAYSKRRKNVGMYKDGILIKTFSSISQASKETKCSRTAIENRILNKINSSLKGFEWGTPNA